MRSNRWTDTGGHVLRATARRARGFTFVETLAAMLFMAIVIPVVIQGLSVANKATVVAERKRVAGQLADRVLTEQVVTGQWRFGDDAGGFGEGQPDYHWVLRSTPWPEDTLRLVSVEVWFQVQGEDYHVRLSTLVEEETAA